MDAGPEQQWNLDMSDRVNTDPFSAANAIGVEGRSGARNDRSRLAKRNRAAIIGIVNEDAVGKVMKAELGDMS
jgi:hypothetical protein